MPQDGSHRTPPYSRARQDGKSAKSTRGFPCLSRRRQDGTLSHGSPRTSHPAHAATASDPQSASNDSTSTRTPAYPTPSPSPLSLAGAACGYPAGVQSVGAGWEQEVFKQKKRLADAQRILQSNKPTKKAAEDEHVATKKIENYWERLADLKRTTSNANDGRIFQMMFAPVIVNNDGQRVIRPMRYICRFAGKPSFYDRKFLGTYNARRDNLEGSWSSLYGAHHAVMWVENPFQSIVGTKFSNQIVQALTDPCGITHRLSLPRRGASP